MLIQELQMATTRTFNVYYSILHQDFLILPMKNHRSRLQNKIYCYLIVLALVLSVTFLCFETELDVNNNPSQHAGYSVYTQGCKIPDIDPWDASIRHLITKVEPLVCNGSEFVTSLRYTGKGHVYLEVKDKYLSKVGYCLYQTIQRAPFSDKDIRYGPEVRFKAPVRLREDFCRTICYDDEGGLLGSALHAAVPVKTQKRMPRNKEQMNIIALGIDSVSQLNFARHMHQTRKFLLDELGAVELKGFNKVADNTYVNIAPMFAGRFVEELPWNEQHANQPFDSYPWLWKNAEKAGYHTLYAEDAPEIAIFNYNKAGFRQPPAQHYLRPFSVAMEQHGSLWSQGRDCVGQKLETEVILDYILDFCLQYKTKPFFAFAFITRLTHDNVNKAGLADLPYLKFLQQLRKLDIFENTALLLYSDHGMRFGQLRQTNIGRLEERLPGVYIVLPPKFRRHNPHKWHHLNANAHALTTPFDIYETLRDLMRSPASSKTDRAFSLLSPVPSSRTCSDAAILPHWCTCQQQLEVNVHDARVRAASSELIDSMNAQLIGSEQCIKLELDQVLNSAMLMTNDDVLSFKESRNDVMQRRVIRGERPEAIIDWRITIRTKTSYGIFEATVRCTHNLAHDRTCSVLGEVSRINAYGLQSHCITKHSLKKFCFCQPQL